MNLPVRAHRRGFALVIVLLLLGLLTLCVLSLSMLGRVSGQWVNTGEQRTVARQHAWLGLNLALAELQRQAGSDDCATAMAGITGIPAGAAQTTRHWCGVWQSDGSFSGWLVSGAATTAAAQIAPGTEIITLVGRNTVGASSSESEHVVAGKVPVVVAETKALPGQPVRLGAYAYLVLDEGVKVSAYARPDRLVVPGVAPLVSRLSGTTAQERLRAALATYSPRLPAVLSYEQLALLPAPSEPLTGSTLGDNFHHTTLTAEFVIEGQPGTGALNVNTTSRLVWSSLCETYERVPGAKSVPLQDLARAGRSISAEIAAEDAGKSRHAPFIRLDGLAASGLLARNLPPAVTPEHFLAAVGPMLTVRSDTFRIRAYGESGVTGSGFRGVAFCEAIVQRSVESAPAGDGRRFVIRYFRWLGPDDI